MRVIKVVSALFLAIVICAWIFLKLTGDIGRQFNNGLNIRKSFPIAAVNDEFTLKINPTRKGVYIYSAAFSYDRDKDYPNEAILEFEAKFTEKECASAASLGSTAYSVRDVEGRRTYHKRFPRDGKVIRAPFNNRNEPICLDIKVVKVPETPIPDLELGVSVYNTRACWFVECLLD